MMGIPRAAALAALTAAAVAAALAAAGGAAGVSLQRETPASDSDLYAAGAAYERLPAALSAGDWNGDGYDDVLACSWENSRCVIYLGRAGPVGTLSAPDVVLVGPSGRFGGAAAFVGDVNDDGYPDVAVGAPATTVFVTAPSGGSLWVFFGRQHTPGGSVGYYYADTRIASTVGNASLGSTVAPAGDMDGDGVDDLWVSAPHEDRGGGYPGVLYLFRGNRSLPSSMTQSNASRALVGITPDYAGTHVLLGGRDLDGNGWPDLVVSSRDFRDGTGARVGAAMVFLGPLRSVPAVLTPQDTDVTLWGSATVPWFGGSLALSENFAAGGARVLFVGADLYDNASGRGGAVYAFHASRLACCGSLYPWDADGLLYSPGAADRMGAAVAVGDWDGDGLEDLAVGAPEAAVTGGPRTGRAFLFYGGVVGGAPVEAGSAPAWVNGPRTDALFGTLLVALDFNGDGKDDFVAGAPGDSRSSTGAGGIYGFYGRERNRPPTLSLSTVPSATEGQRINASITAADPDGDRLTWTWYLDPGVPEGPTANRRLVNFTFPDEGSFEVLVVLTDGEYVVADARPVTVANVAPACRLRAQIAFVEGRQGSVLANITEPGNDTVTLEWSGPPGMVFDGAQGTYTPPLADAFFVQLWVTDDIGAAGSCSLEVPVINMPPTVTIDGPSEFYEGEVVTFVASAVDPGTSDVVTFVWRTPLGSHTGAVLTWVPTRLGYIDIHLSGEDLYGGEGTAVYIVHVLSRTPAVGLLVPTGIREGEAAELGVVQHAGAAYDALSLVWEVCGYPRAGPQPGGYTVARAAPGRCDIHVTVVDDDGETVHLYGALNVSNRPPAENITVSVGGPYAEDQEVEFRVELATWETAAPHAMKHAWRLDGALVSEAAVLALRLPGGEHHLTLEVEDPWGGRSALGLVLIARNEPPAVFIEGPTAIRAGEVASWAAVGRDPPAHRMDFVWEVDGVRRGEGAEFTWSAAAPGRHTLRVVAVDPAGGTSDYELTVEVLGGAAGGIEAAGVALWAVAAAAFVGGVLLGGKGMERLRGRVGKE